MSRCIDCKCGGGEHFKWCEEVKNFPNGPEIAKRINIPIVPEDAALPDFDDVAMEVVHYGFTTKDSGYREQFSSGMVRDIQTNKPRYDLIGWGWKLIKRWAELVGRGAVKYGELNFEKANSEEEYRRFKSSALRHMIQYFEGETDEDHAAAVCFNLAGAEAVKEKLKNAEIGKEKNND